MFTGVTLSDFTTAPGATAFTRVSKKRRMSSGFDLAKKLR
jgi:hypothetical protein